MNHEIRVLVLAILSVSFSISSCKKEPVPIQYDLTSDDLQWLPYDVVGFQPFYMRDETGYVHHLNLHIEQTRDFGYWDPPSSNNKAYYEQNYNSIHFGRHFCGCYLKKDKNGLELSFYGQGRYGQVFSDYDLHHPMDSVNVHGTVFYNVLVAEIDTTISDPDVDTDLWKIYVVKGLGVVGADYRNGQYYVME